MREEKNSSNGRPRGGGAPALFAGTGFLLLAAWFLYGTDPATVPEARSARVNPAVLVPGPRRTPLGGPPRVELAGFTYTCMDCHRLFKTAQPQSWGLVQHRDIVLRARSHHGRVGHGRARCGQLHEPARGLVERIVRELGRGCEIAPGDNRQVDQLLAKLRVGRVRIKPLAGGGDGLEGQPAAVQLPQVR